MREHVEDAGTAIESWIEAFKMVQGEDGKWSYAAWVDDALEVAQTISRSGRQVEPTRDLVQQHGAPPQCRPSTPR